MSVRARGATQTPRLKKNLPCLCGTKRDPPGGRLWSGILLERMEMKTGLWWRRSCVVVREARVSMQNAGSQRPTSRLSRPLLHESIRPTNQRYQGKPGCVEAFGGARWCLKRISNWLRLLLCLSSSLMLWLFRRSMCVCGRLR